MNFDVTKQAQSKENGIFINGKAQAVEILRLLDPDERRRLLGHMKLRNPEMTMELSQKAISFLNLIELSNHELRVICNHVEAQIMGVALKNSSLNFQKRVLSTVDREYAEKAYEGLIANLRNDHDSSMKAQEKIIGIAIQLNKKRQINFN